MLANLLTFITLYRVHVEHNNVSSECLTWPGNLRRRFDCTMLELSMPANFNGFCDCVLSNSVFVCSPFSFEKSNRDSNGMIPLTVTVRVAGYLQVG